MLLILNNWPLNAKNKRIGRLNEGIMQWRLNEETMQLMFDKKCDIPLEVIP